MIEPAEPPGADVSRLRICDLGSLVIQVDGAEVTLRGDKPMRILATLLVHVNRRVPTDVLYETVWGDQSVGPGTGTLESHIWRIRKAMEPHRVRRQQSNYLVNDAGGYRLTLNPGNADSLRFVQLAEQGDRLLVTGDADRALGRYDQALLLWRGRPFEPIADEEMAAASIARLEETHALLLEQRVEARLRLGGAAGVVGELEDLVRRFPFRERLWSQLMLALYQSHRAQEALDTYQRARTTLLDSLGIDPGANLQTLHQRILQRDATLDPPPSSQPSAPPGRPSLAAGTHLPARLSPLIGREEELRRVAELVRRRRLVTLVGAAGAGKTRLAIDVARSAADVVPDGIWFVDLTAVDDPRAVADLVAATIGVEQPVLGDSLTALEGYFRDRQVLLVVDNCEHVLTAVYAMLEVVLSPDTQCRVLATSREPIGLDGEVRWTLAPLSVRDSTGDETSPAAELFVERASSADPLFEPTEADWAQIEEICAAVDGLPLAIELAAGRIRDASLAELRTVVATELGSLGRLGHVPDEHRRTIEASIAWSVQLLSAEEQAVHVSLSALPGVFTVDAARAVANGDDVARGAVPALLTQLAHRSLLSPVAGDGRGRPTRYRQLATVRAHAGQALAQAHGIPEARRRREDFVLGLAHACPAPSAADESGWYAMVSDNHDTVAAVLHDTISSRPSPAGSAVLGRLSSYWYYRGRVSEGERWMLAAADHPADPQDRALVQLALAYAHGLHDRTDLSLPLVRQALTVRPTEANRQRFAYGLVVAAWCAWVQADRALDFVDEEVRLLAGGDEQILAWADLLAAKTALASDGPAATASRAGALTDRCDQIGNFSAAWLAASLAGLCDLLLGDAAAGQARMIRIEDYYQRLGGSVAANHVEFNGNFAALAGDFEEAARHYGLASALAYRYGTLWPLSPSTSQFIAEARRALPTDVFEAAWRAGDAMSRLPNPQPAKR